MMKEVTKSDILEVYGVISETNERWFRTYGKFTDNRYDERMKNLEKGTLQKVLNESPLSRDIINGMLIHHLPAMIYGRGGAFFSQTDVNLGGFQHDLVKGNLDILFREGLLDSFFDRCGPTYWVFNSELPETAGGRRKVIINSKLRSTLSKIIL